MPYNFISSSGVIVPDTSTTKETVQAEYRSLFGDDLSIDDATPQGALINAETVQRDALSRNNADLANQINPNIASGTSLDAIFALTNGQRQQGLPTTFSVAPTLTGTSGTFIPEGSRCQTGDGDIFVSTESATIGIDGETTANFQSVENQPINVAIGQLNQIIDGVLGWETVTNTVASTPGRVTQSDQQARIFRSRTLAVPGRSTIEAISANVRVVNGVRGLSIRENDTSTPITSPVLIAAHSIYVVVQGGSNSDVGVALLKSKSAGAGWTNNSGGTPVTVNVADEVSGQTYMVRFDRPLDVPIRAIVTATVPPNTIDGRGAVVDAVLAYANGDITGEQGFVVGSAISPFEIACAVTVANPSFLISKVEISKVSDDDLKPQEIPINLYEVGSISSSNIAVVLQ